MKHSLNFAEDYVKDWTIYDAIREFLQNALDQSKTKENNDMNIVYDKDTQKLFMLFINFIPYISYFFIVYFYERYIFFILFY